MIVTWSPPQWDEESDAWWVWTPYGWRCRTASGDVLWWNQAFRYQRMKVPA